MSLIERHLLDAHASARRRRVVISDDDPDLTARAGLALVAETDRVLGIGAEIDAQVGRSRVAARDWERVAWCSRRRDDARGRGLHG
jgi:hypothetical protein